MSIHLHVNLVSHHDIFASTILCFVSSGRCSATGDPHYRTFDGKYYSFMGHCQYVLAQDAVSSKFAVTVDNFPCGTDNTQGCTKTVSVLFNSTSVHLKRGSSVAVNGQDLSIFPYKSDGKAYLE